jgi:hypothetical protein
MKRRRRYPVGTAIVDCETGIAGRVVHLYEDPELRDEVVVVKFDLADYGVAVPIDTIRPAPVAQRRRGGKS